MYLNVELPDGLYPIMSDVYSSVLAMLSLFKRWPILMKLTRLYKNMRNQSLLSLPPYIMGTRHHHPYT